MLNSSCVSLKLSDLHLVICPVSIMSTVLMLACEIGKQAGQFTTHCKGDKVIALKQQKSLWWDSA